MTPGDSFLVIGPSGAGKSTLPATAFAAEGSGVALLAPGDVELASYRFEPPAGLTHTDVLFEAHLLRVERGDPNIQEVHLADAIEILATRSRRSLSDDRSPKNPY